jgi:hypothetical protein
MTEKQFLNKLTGDSFDLIEGLSSVLNELQTPYCLIGGLAVNAYVEPVVSLDLDMVISLSQRDSFLNECRSVFKITNFPFSVNLEHPKSDLRIQIQTDERYQSFIKNAALKNVMGYPLMVASPEDVLQGKIWAYLDTERRKSKRQKDLSDIMRLVEKYPDFHSALPESIKSRLA